MSSRRPSITSIPAQCVIDLAIGITSLNNRIEDDVSEICRKVLKPFREDYRSKIERRSTEGLDRCLKDIVRSLRIHLCFHWGVAESSMTETGIDMEIETETTASKDHETGCYGEIAELESGLGLISKQEEENILEFVIDPGSLLLEMVSWEAAIKLHN